jgi:hypothetical protein
LPFLLPFGVPVFLAFFAIKCLRRFSLCHLRDEPPYRCADGRSERRSAARTPGRDGASSAKRHAATEEERPAMTAV